MTDADDVRIVAQTPDPATFCKFYAALGWGHLTLEQAERSLAGALFTVVALRGETTLGFGRVTGDGVINFHLEDIIVSETERGQGIGQQIVRALLAWIETVAVRDGMISLTASEGKEPFYERFGFSTRPAPGYGAGMMRLMKGMDRDKT